jgi:hypothetical protein
MWKLVRLGISMCLLYGFWRLLSWKPLWGFLKPVGPTRNRAGFLLILVAILFWWVSVFSITFSRRKSQKAAVATRSAQPVLSESRYLAGNQACAIPRDPTPPRVPGVRFADVGGLEDEKQQIRELVDSRVQPGKYSSSGVARQKRTTLEQSASGARSCFASKGRESTAGYFFR